MVAGELDLIKTFKIVCPFVVCWINTIKEGDWGIERTLSFIQWHMSVAYEEGGLQPKSFGH